MIEPIYRLVQITMFTISRKYDIAYLLADYIDHQNTIGSYDGVFA